MARVKGAQNRSTRKSKLFGKAKGFHAARKNTFRQANQAVMKAESYKYVGRKQKKRAFRRLWITRITAAVKMHDLRYSQFIHGIQKAGIKLNRKELSEMAIHDPATFGAICGQAKTALS